MPPDDEDNESGGDGMFAAAVHTSLPATSSAICITAASISGENNFSAEYGSMPRGCPSLSGVVPGKTVNSVPEKDELLAFLALVVMASNVSEKSEGNQAVIVDTR